MDTIKHRLLYCHSIALDDPLGYLVLGATFDPYYKNCLLNFVTLLIHLRPLIDANILSFVTWEVYQSPRPSTSLTYLFRKYSAERDTLPEPDLAEFQRRAPNEVVSHWDSILKQELGKTLIARSLTTTATRRIDAMLSLLSDAPGRLSLYFPFRYDIKLISTFQHEFSKSVRELGSTKVPDRENRLLTELVNIDLPGVSTLTPDDIVAIRRAGAFEQWRVGLKEGLRRASDLPPDLLDIDQASRQAVAEALRPAYEVLQQEFARSPTLMNARSAMTTLVAGGIGAFVGYQIDPNIGSFAGAAVTSFSQAVLEFVGKMSETKNTMPHGSRKLSMDHYVAVLN